MAPRTYTGITPGRFAAIITEADQKTGLQLNGPSGTASEHGVTLQWQYDAATEILVLHCLAKPWIVSEACVDEKLDALVAGAQEESHDSDRQSPVLPAMRRHSGPG
jgi:hypothetical protein